MNKIKIGWSEVSLVPEGKKVSLAGQFYERVSDEVLSPISVTALALECNGEEAILCSCDLTGVSHKLLTTVRNILASDKDFPVDKLIIHATHTHTSIMYARNSDTPAGGLTVLQRLAPDNFKYEALVDNKSDDILDGEEAHAFIAERIAEAAQKARNARSEACYAQGFGRAAVGMCRRVCYDDGSAKMWGDTNMANFTELEAGNDSGIELIFTYTPDKKLTGIVANVACPSQVLEHRSIISADYWGEVKKLIREKYGDDIFVLGLCSAAGDQCPRDMIRWVNPETPINDPNIEREIYIERNADPSMFDIKGCKLAGRRIATEIIYALEDVDNYVEDTILIHRPIKMNVPLRRVTIEEKDKALEAVKKFFEESDGTFNYKDNAKMHIYAGTIARYELQQEVDMDEIEIHVLRLGDIAFATNPYELFLNYGNQIRARSKAKQTFLIQLCCGSSGYLPTEKAESGSHYSAYVSSGTTGHIGGEMLVRKTLSEIRDMWAQ